MTLDKHLSNDLLIRSIDDEVCGTEMAAVESHLAKCEACRQAHQALRQASLKIEALIAGVAPEHPPADRDRLAHNIERREHLPIRRAPRLVYGFGWGMAIAATLAIAILFMPTRKAGLKSAFVNNAPYQMAFEVDGESFVALPYSNPELPMNSPHIVQMQVPVSSLADAGIVFEPIANRVSGPDDTVLADVLLGIDGQPLGVHVVGQ